MTTEHEHLPWGRSHEPSSSSAAEHCQQQEAVAAVEELAGGAAGQQISWQLSRGRVKLAQKFTGLTLSQFGLLQQPLPLKFENEKSARLTPL